MITEKLSYRISDILINQTQAHPAAYRATHTKAPYKWPYNVLYVIWKVITPLP